MRDRPRTQDLFQRGNEGVAVAYPGGVVGEAGIGRKPRDRLAPDDGQRLAQPAELAVVADRDRDGPVGGAQRLVGRDTRVPIAQPARHHAAVEIPPRGQGRPSTDGFVINVFPERGFLECPT